jgi:rhodanese-related sulfurtransferase
MPKIQNSTPKALVFGGFRRNGDGSFPFTMVPNQFLDEVLPHEKTCVVKVVGLILRRTIGWLDARTGQRRQQEQVAYSEFCREMKMSTQSVAEGLRIALEKGYIVRVKPGSLRGEGTGEPEGAWYSLNWEIENGSGTQGITTTNGNKMEAVPNERDSSFQRGGSENAALNSGDMLNTCDSQESKKVELQANSSLDNYVNADKQEQKSQQGKFSRYLGNVIRDVSNLFGDSAHELPNIKQALNIWRSLEHGLDEKDFARLVYKARDITRHKVSGVTKSAEMPINRMPYFFAVLRDLVRQLLPNSSAKPEKPEKKVGSSKSRPATKPLYNPNHSEKQKNKAMAEIANSVAELVADDCVVEEADDIQSAGITEAQYSLQNAVALSNESEQEVCMSETLALVQAEPSITPTQYDWITTYLGKPDEVITNWQRLVAAIGNIQLQKLASKLLGVNIEQVPVELAASISSVTDAKSQTIVLFCRNMFDAKQAALYLRELRQIAEHIWERPVQLQPIYF